MNAQEHIVQNKGKMLVFDLAEKLKVVGTLHALNQEDKKELEQLVDATDFIASETWPNDESEREQVPIPFVKALKYDEELKIFTCSYLDSRYINWFLNSLAKSIRKTTEREMAQTSVARDWKEHEFEYCQQLAKEKNKEFYIADIPVHEIYAYLTNQSNDAKRRQMRGQDSNTFNKMWRDLNSLRERAMLKGIAQREGPISQMQRQGLLIVGYTHALNYLSGKHSELLQ
jgi:hypothetical protein